jgi:group I intron endonuclease
MESGIYTITCTSSGKMYVGLTTNFQERWSNHKTTLRKGTHRNSYLQRVWNKYGESNFLFEILEECSEDFLFSQEHYWCNMLSSHDKRYGFNFRPTSPYGNVRTPKQTLCKMRESKIRNAKSRGYWFSEKTNYKRKETRRKQSVKPFDVFKSGVTIKSFNTLVEAEEDMRIDKRAIWNALNRNKSHSSNGYTFKYKEV